MYLFVYTCAFLFVFSFLCVLCAQTLFCKVSVMIKIRNGLMCVYLSLSLSFVHLSFSLFCTVGPCPYDEPCPGCPWSWPHEGWSHADKLHLPSTEPWAHGHAVQEECNCSGNGPGASCHHRPGLRCPQLNGQHCRVRISNNNNIIYFFANCWMVKNIKICLHRNKNVKFHSFNVKCMLLFVYYLTVLGHFHVNSTIKAKWIVLKFLNCSVCSPGVSRWGNA